ncbi:MAG: hypothetical protein PHX86_06990 [Caldisericia bacterium]|nr:hypothetical protein [Caldisericia bacterium]
MIKRISLFIVAAVVSSSFFAEYAGYEVMWDPAEEKVTLLWDKN